MAHREWFEETTGNASVNAAAKASGLVQTTLNSQLQRGRLAAESVIELARAYDLNPVQALIDTDYLSVDEARGEVTIVNWADVPDMALLKELLSRVDSEGLLSRPLDNDAIQEAQAAPEVELLAAYDDYALAAFSTGDAAAIDAEAEANEIST